MHTLSPNTSMPQLPNSLDMPFLKQEIGLLLVVGVVDASEYFSSVEQGTAADAAQTNISTSQTDADDDDALSFGSSEPLQPWKTSASRRIVWTPCPRPS
jgi:hypothetical protein